MRMIKNMNSLVIIAILVLVAVAALITISCQRRDAVKAPVVRPSSNVIHPEWSKNANIYEVNVRQYTAEGTFLGFEQHLPRLKDMGVDILWFMPVHPIGEKNRKGTLGSYYSIKDYKGINPEFGTMDDFKLVVSSAHKLGMKVIIDWVANHSAWDNPWVIEHPEYYVKDSLGNMVSPFDWTDVVKLNYDEPALRDAMIDAMKFWLTEADIDGFRCDVAMEVPTDFWDRARKELDQVKPVFMLAEAEQPDHHTNAFDMSYGWEFHHIMHKIAKGEAVVKDIKKYFHKQDSLYPLDAYRMYFTTNHDENSWNGTEFEKFGKGNKTFFVLAATIPGMPLIYSGQEAGLDKRLDFFEKDTIDWTGAANDVFYHLMLSVKRENPALWNGAYGGTMEFLPVSDTTNSIAYARSKEENTVLVILNLSNTLKEIKLKTGDYAGDYFNALDGTEKSFGKNEKLSLKSWDYQIWLRK